MLSVGGLVSCPLMTPEEQGRFPVITPRERTAWIQHASEGDVRFSMLNPAHTLAVLYVICAEKDRTVVFFAAKDRRPAPDVQAFFRELQGEYPNIKGIDVVQEKLRTEAKLQSYNFNQIVFDPEEELERRVAAAKVGHELLPQMQTRLGLFGAAQQPAVSNDGLRRININSPTG